MTKFAKFMMVSLLGILVSVAAWAQEQDSVLQTLDTWGEARGWEGVGLLIIEQRKSCTGVLIRNDLVITAAHCLYDEDSGTKADPRKIEFRAGWRDGKAIAMRRGKSAIIHPRYAASKKTTGEQLRYDVAMIQLEAPILATHANPFRVGGGVRTGNVVSVVSYGKGRNNAPSRQRSCTVLQATGGLVAMSCDAIYGSSGSPVFLLERGRPVIVSLVSSIGDVEGEQVSYGMDIAQPLSRLMTDFRAGRGVFPVTSFGAKRIGVGQGRTVGGARFLKP